MKKLSYNQLNKLTIADIIHPFYEKRLLKLRETNLKFIIKRKNPYLYKAKNILTAGDLAKYLLDAFLSSQEETIFGDLLENFAVHICKHVFNGYKAEKGKFPSIDLVFKRKNKLYIVGIKSGPNWGNSDQIRAMKINFEKAKQLLNKKDNRLEVIKMNGCMYGRDNQSYKKDIKTPRLSYYKICGQRFWELISGDNRLYKKIIQPLNKEIKKRDEKFQNLYVNKLNEMTKDLVNTFYTKNSLDWDKIIDYVSKEKFKMK
jgi:site-specific DNA-methyltransferase (cytosine-N4-specific)